jgi:UDP-N-acetylmuramoylalanine--D-glutamate ligase
MAAVWQVPYGHRKNKLREAVQNFQSLEHRMSGSYHNGALNYSMIVRPLMGTPTWYAFGKHDKNLRIFILGGVDKGNDYLPD